VKSRSIQETILRGGVFLWLNLSVLLCSWSLLGQAQQMTPAPAQAAASNTQVPAAGQQPASGSISGTVQDLSGALAVGARVQLTSGLSNQQVQSGENGEFSFANLSPGPFQLTISAPGFVTQTLSGVLRPGEAHIVPPVKLAYVKAVTEVQVGARQQEIAEAEIQQEEKQRVLGIIPNFYVSYGPNAAPLTAKQKFGLAWKSSIDPMTILGAGMLAGVYQAADEYGAYGQGAAGYGRRFGAAYGDVFIATFIDSAALPALFKQDPRYFYQGAGTIRSRLLHALSNAVVRKGDNGRWQPNYSGTMGAFASGAISYTYYPSADRGAGLLVQNALINIAGGAVAGVFQEFVLRKFTTHHSAPQP
jgi:hypothetical protein